MGESTGGTDETGVVEGSAVPEGAEGRAADSAFGDELPPFPREHKSAGTLDLAAANDEPTQLIRMLIVAAHEHIGESEHDAEWKMLLNYFERAHNELQRMQEPSRKGAKFGSL